MPNIDLLQRTLAHIKAHPEQWDQGNYASQTDANGCSTAYCFAGWAVTLAHPGAVPLFRPAPEHWATDRTATTVLLDLSAGAEPVSIPDVAQEHLELDNEDAETLFLSDNTLDDLSKMVANLVQGLAADGLDHDAEDWAR